MGDRGPDRKEGDPAAAENGLLSISLRTRTFFSTGVSRPFVSVLPVRQGNAGEDVTLGSGDIRSKQYPGDLRKCSSRKRHGSDAELIGRNQSRMIRHYALTLSPSYVKTWPMVAACFHHTGSCAGGMTSLLRRLPAMAYTPSAASVPDQTRI